MADDVTLVYEGPQVRIVELDRDVGAEAGSEELTVPTEIAGRLLNSDGFREKGKRAQPGPKLASRKTLEARAADLGLQVYESEEDERLATRIRDHGGDPYTGRGEGSAKKSSSGGKKPTPKQQAVDEAKELGLATDGTELEIRERIAEHLGGDQGGSNGGGD